jgi:hypothetical protein
MAKIATTKMIFFTALWIFSMLSFLILITNFFTESLFQNKYIGFYMIMFVSTISIIRLYSVYRKNPDLKETE